MLEFVTRNIQPVSDEPARPSYDWRSARFYVVDHVVFDVLRAVDWHCDIDILIAQYPSVRITTFRCVIYGANRRTSRRFA